MLTSIVKSILKLFGPKPAPKMTHEILISEDRGKSYETLYQYPSQDEAESEVTRFTRIARETSNGNIYFLRAVR